MSDQGQLGTSDDAAESVPSSVPVGAGLVLLAVGVGVIQRGAYNPTTRAVVVLLAGLGLLVSLLGRNRPAGVVVRALVVGWVLLVGSALLSAVVAGDPGGALEVAGLATVFVAGAAAAAATPVSARALVADALLIVAVVVAGTAWVGVVWRVNPLAYPVGGLWRGASTLTYANAAAALLGTVVVFSMVRLAADRHAGRLVVLGTYVAGVGFATTLNRAGVVAVAVGVVVAFVAVRPVRLAPVVVRQAVAVFIGAAAVLPGLVADRSTQPVLSMVALLVGAAVAVGVDRRWSTPTRAVVLVLVGLLVVVGGVVAAPALRDGAERVAEARLDVGGDDRAGAWGAAVDELTSSPVVGVGPSTTSFVWTDGGEAWRIKYAHNEYLELLATQGLVGALATIVAVVLLVRSRRAFDLGPAAWLAPAVAAALVAFLVHSTFDFLLHVPVLALVAGTISGLALPTSTSVRGSD